VTYDLAVWRHRGPLSDADASVEFERRIDLAEARALDEADPPSSEVMALFARLRERFPDEPWENSEDEADGDFLYINCSYPDGPWVEAAIAEWADELGIVVYSPMSEAVVRPGDTFGPGGPPAGGRQVS